jgi:hypothetical protein
VQAVGVNATDKPAPKTMSGDFATKPAAAQPSGYKQACLTCHGEDVIQQQRLTKAQWQREVDKMVRWGAQVKDSDREGILQYLSRF